MATTIPKGKKLVINLNGSPLVNVPLVLEEPITINLSSSFEPVFGGGDTKIFDLIGSLSRDVLGNTAGFSGQFKQLSIQTWKGTDPVSLPSITIGLYVDKTNVDAYNQVYLPTKKLRELPLPDERRSGNLIPPGPSLLEALGKKNSNWPTYSLRIGKILYLPQIIIKKAEPTYSNETDAEGYPIWAKVALDIQSISTATKKLMDT
ncbi:MAG: hypothetical protein ACOC3V_00320 [bacterium]